MPRKCNTLMPWHEPVQKNSESGGILKNVLDYIEDWSGLVLAGIDTEECVNYEGLVRTGVGWHG